MSWAPSGDWEKMQILGQQLWVGAWHPYKPFLSSDAEAGRPGPHFEWQEFPKNSPASTRISNVSSEEPNGEC